MDDIELFVEQQDELEEVWQVSIDKYRKLWGPEGCDFLSKVTIGISPLAGERNALALTYRDMSGNMRVSFNPLIDSLDDTYLDVVLHEMCHCVAYLNSGKLDHNEEWRYLADSLNSKAGYNITETMDEAQLEASLI